MARTYLDYINEAYNSKDLTAAQKEASKAEADLTKLQQQAVNFIPNKTKELVAADPALQQLNAERAKFTGQLYSKPFEARSQYADIFDPIKREALVSQAIGNVTGQLAGTQGMIGLRQQKNSDLAEQAYNILQSQIDIGKTKYGKATDRAAAIEKLLTTAAGKEYDRQTAKELAAYKAGLDGTKNPKYTIKQNPQSYFDPTTQQFIKQPGGIQVYKDGVPVSPAEYASGVGLNLAQVLASSPSKDDQELAQQLAKIIASGDVTEAQKFRDEHGWLFGDITAAQ